MSAKTVKSVVVFGPAGCGKTRHAKRLAAHFGLTCIKDGWSPGKHLPPMDTLLLTNHDLSEAAETERRVISFSDAMKLMSGASNG